MRWCIGFELIRTNTYQAPHHKKNPRRFTIVVTMDYETTAAADRNCHRDAGSTFAGLRFKARKTGALLVSWCIGSDHGSVVFVYLVRCSHLYPYQLVTLFVQLYLEQLRCLYGTVESAIPRSVTCLLGRVESAIPRSVTCLLGRVESAIPTIGQDRVTYTLISYTCLFCRVKSAVP